MQYPNYYGQTFTQGQSIDPNANINMSFSETLPQPMSGNMTETNLYPLEESYNNTQFRPNYAHGGRVKSRKKESINVLPSLAEIIRQQGNNEDSILAHINPLEAHILKKLGGSGTINKKTGLPQFGFLNKPGKALMSVAGGGIGAVLGNMILPGIGGIVGGALGQGIQHAARGKSLAEGVLKGGAMGAALPTGANLAGSGLTSLGAKGIGSTLSNYGAKNAILQSLGSLGSNAASKGSSLNLFSQGNSGMSPLSRLSSNTLMNSLLSNSGGNKQQEGFTPDLSSLLNQQTSPKKEEQSFTDSLLGNSKKFLTKPKNLLTLASVASSFADKPKKMTPERQAEEHKRYLKGMMLTPAERAALEAEKLAERQMERRIERNQYLPEERFELTPRYRKVLTPAEYKKSGRWFEYYDNPNFIGSPIPMKHGGRVPKVLFEEIQITSHPKHDGIYLNGQSKGQKDDVEILASNGEYIIPADVVAHAGDGNSIAGGKEFDRLVKNIRKSKGGRITLPPKAKSIAYYMNKR